jgi:hypothetical protein
MFKAPILCLKSARSRSIWRKDHMLQDDIWSASSEPSCRHARYNLSERQTEKLFMRSLIG